MNKPTSEMESTHKIWLGNGRINCLLPLARQTSSSPYIFAYISKNRLGWIPIVFVYIACIGSYQATMGPPFSSQHLCAMFDSISQKNEFKHWVSFRRRAVVWVQVRILCRVRISGRPGLPTPSPIFRPWFIPKLIITRDCKELARIWVQIRNLHKLRGVESRGY